MGKIIKYLERWEKILFKIRLNWKETNGWIMEVGVEAKTKINLMSWRSGVFCNNIIISCPQFWSSLMELRTIYKYRAHHLSRRGGPAAANIFLLCRQTNLRLWDLMCESFSIFPESQVLLVGGAAFNGLRIWCFYEVIL